MSQVLGLREVIANERLRSDHIETLEILQNSKNENIELKFRIQELEDKLNSMHNRHDDLKDDQDSKHLVDNAFIMIKLQEQAEHIQNLQHNLSSITAEYKTSKIVASKRIREAEQVLQTNNVISLELQMKLIQYEMWNSMLSEDICAYSLRNTNFHCKSDVVSVPILTTIITETETQSQTFKHIFTQTDKIDEAKNCSIDDTRETVKRLESRLSSQYLEINTLHKEIEDKGSEIKSLKNIIEKTVSQSFETATLMRPDADEITVDCVGIVTNNAIVRNSKESNVEFSEDLPLIPTISDEEIAGSGFGFAEFVRLRKENKVLRLQIAQLSGEGSRKGLQTIDLTGERNKTNHMIKIQPGIATKRSVVGIKRR